MSVSLVVKPSILKTSQASVENSPGGKLSGNTPKITITAPDLSEKSYTGSLSTKNIRKIPVTDVRIENPNLLEVPKVQGRKRKREEVESPENSCKRIKIKAQNSIQLQSNIESLKEILAASNVQGSHSGCILDKSKVKIQLRCPRDNNEKLTLQVSFVYEEKLMASSRFEIPEKLRLTKVQQPQESLTLRQIHDTAINSLRRINNLEEPIIGHHLSSNNDGTLSLSVCCILKDLSFLSKIFTISHP